MVRPQILTKSRFSLGNIHIAPEIVSSREADREFDSTVDAVWAQALQEANKEGKNLWNSTLYRFEGFSETKSSLTMQFSEIQYKEMIAWRRQEQPTSRPGRTHSAAFVGCLMKTTDDKFVFGRLSGKTYLSPRIILIGGILSKTEMLIHSSTNLWDFILKEAKEELGITPSAFLNQRFLGIFRTSDSSIGILLQSDLSLSSGELSDIFRYEAKDEELRSVVFCDSKKMKSFLNESGYYIPILAGFDWEN